MKSFTVSSPKYGAFEVLVDDCDYELVIKYHWCVRRCNLKFYVTRNEWANNKAKKIDLHRFLMGFPVGKLIDHKDGDTCNNQRENLRIANGKQNASNKNKQKNNTTGFKGVAYYKPYKKYAVSIVSDAKQIFGGYYSDILEAAYAYNLLCIKYHKDFAWLNKFTADEQKWVDQNIKTDRPHESKKVCNNKYRGVEKAINGGPSKPYYSKIMINKKRIGLGYFATEIEAAKAYNEGLVKYGGDLRKLNKIPNE